MSVIVFSHNKKDIILYNIGCVLVLLALVFLAFLIFYVFTDFFENEDKQIPKTASLVCHSKLISKIECYKFELVYDVKKECYDQIEIVNNLIFCYNFDKNNVKRFVKAYPVNNIKFIRALYIEPRPEDR